MRILANPELPQELWLDETAPSLNKLVRMHWTTRRDLLARWGWLIKSAAAGRSFPQGKVEIRITRCSPRTMDTDNLHGAAKVVLDAMKGCGIIQDDSPAHIALICDQVKASPPRTIISIRSLDAD